MKSIWQENIEKPKFSALKGDIKTDVLIIGGGMAGLLCGFTLKNAGIDCVIAEKDVICGGVTKNTTAKITCHHGAVFDKMIKRFGTERAGLYLKAQSDAVKKYRRLSKEIDCDFCDVTSFVYSKTDREKIEKEVAALNKLGLRVNFTNRMSLPFMTAGAVEMKNQAQFNPLKFAYGIANGLKIFENTEVLEITKDGAITKKGKISAESIIVTTHFPFSDRHGMYFLKLYQHRSYVLALDNAPKVKGIYVDENEKGMSFREYNGLMLLGGGGHRTGKQGGGYNELRNFAAVNYPTSKEVCHFATQDCKTLDDIPYIGQYSKNTPNLYVATGFNKWGMTNSMVAAEILCDLITGHKNIYAEVFNPSRSIMHRQIFLNGIETPLKLLTPTATRCTHLGCALKYNKQEHSWDCPCHGSRFSDNGKVINNPAKKNLK